MANDTDKLLGADLHVTGMNWSVSCTPQGESHKLSFSRLELDGFDGALGDVSYRAAAVSIDGMNTTLGRAQVTADGADVVDIQLDAPDLSLRARRISCPRGLMYTGSYELSAPHMSFEDVRLVIDNLDRPGKQDDNTDEPLDLHFLDVLQGQLDIDLAVDMTLPWVGRRRVTHYFRVPIENGTIDYEKLENDVHWLEAAFVTIDLVGDELVLARDIPLVPIAGKALLKWPLEPADIPLTDFRRVHIRNLLRPQVVAADPKPGKKPRSKLTLHSLAMNNIKLDLQATSAAQIALPGDAMLQFGDDSQAGISGLTLAGELHYQPEPPTDSQPREASQSEKPASESEDAAVNESASAPDDAKENGASAGPTSIGGTINLIDVTLKDIPLGQTRLSIDRLHIASIDRIDVHFDGFKPQRIEVTLDRMTATNVRLHLDKPA